MDNSITTHLSNLAEGKSYPSVITVVEQNGAITHLRLSAALVGDSAIIGFSGSTRAIGGGEAALKGAMNQLYRAIIEAVKRGATVRMEEFESTMI